MSYMEKQYGITIEIDNNQASELYDGFCARCCAGVMGITETLRCGSTKIKLMRGIRLKSMEKESE